MPQPSDSDRSAQVRNMNDAETAAHLREWVKRKTHDSFAWPTDVCGYEQHIRFVDHRNKNWHGGDWAQFVLDYAAALDPVAK